MSQTCFLENRLGAELRRSGSSFARGARLFAAARGLAYAALIAAVPATAVAQSTIHVPTDQSTIQAGIDAAANGDTVLVAPGTYNENIDFKGKAIRVTSSAGASQTIIDGGSRSGTAVVTFKSHELRTSILSGFTIQHGGTQTGPGQASGGVSIQASAPAVVNNMIVSNRCSGVFANGGALLQANIVASTVYQNPGTDSACQQGGTGIVIEGSTTVGPYSHVDVLGNSVVGNVQAVDVGGIAIKSAEGTFVQNNVIAGNTGASVGAIGTEGVTFVVISNNLVYGNSAGQGNGPGLAGGLQITAPSATVSGNTIAGNSLTSGASGESATEINLAAALAHINLANNIIVGYAPGYPALNCSASAATGTPAFDHNDIYNGNGRAYGGACSDQTGTSGNISADPLFFSVGSAIFHLTAGSPAIDAGDNGAYLMPAIDLEANPRIQDATQKGHPIVDMGAYEYPGVLDGVSYNAVLISSLNPAPSGQQVTFTASITATSTSVGNPAGTVTFTDGSTVLASVPVQVSSPLTATASFSTSALSVGTHPITASFSASAAADTATASLNETITAQTSSTALVSSLNPAPTGQPVTFTATVSTASGTSGAPTGTVQFSDGSTVIATQTLSASGANTAAASFTVSTLIPGSHAITASYGGSAGLSSSSSTLTQVILSNSGTSTVISGSPNPATLGQNVSFVVTVTSAVSTAGPPTGSVTVTLPGGTVLGRQNVSASGAASSQATFSTSSLPLGANIIQASYSPSGNFLSSTGTLTENITTSVVSSGDFSLTPAQFALSIKTQHHATVPLTLTSLNGFQDSVAISCGTLPAYVTCRPTPTPVALSSGSTVPVSLYLDTDSVIGYAQLRKPSSPAVLGRIPAEIGFAILVPGFLFTSRKRLRTRSARLLILLFASLAAGALSGCGSIIIPIQIPPSATPGTYSILITGTGSATGVTHTSTLTLTITP